MAKKKEVKIEEKVEVIEPKSNLPKKDKKSNAWLEHVKKYRADNPDTSYKECLQKAKISYKKGGSIEMTPPEAEPVPVKKMKKVKKVKKVKNAEELV